jgi:hypothetical protein
VDELGQGAPVEGRRRPPQAGDQPHLDVVDALGHRQQRHVAQDALRQDELPGQVIHDHPEQRRVAGQPREQGRDRQRPGLDRRQRLGEELAAARPPQVLDAEELPRAQDAQGGVMPVLRQQEQPHLPVAEEEDGAGLAVPLEEQRAPREAAVPGERQCPWLDETVLERLHARSCRARSGPLSVH